MTGSIVFVHGTGVRLRDYRRSFALAQKQAAAAGIQAAFVECAWGDPLGVLFEGLSLPDPPDEEQSRADALDAARWNWLLEDPLFELDKLTIRDPKQGQVAPLFGEPEWLQAWNRVAAYEPSEALRLLLERGDLTEEWSDAWRETVNSTPLPKEAFKQSARELPEAANALARSVIAHLHVAATAAGKPGPNRALRLDLLERLLFDWDYQVLAPSGFLIGLFKRAATGILRRSRNKHSRMITSPIGDILLYQSRGADIRSYIRCKIAAAEPPVTVMAHSLGGVAAFDLLAAEHMPTVKALITMGSQAPFFYEIGALTSLKTRAVLPEYFPPAWLNLFDRSDFLSFVGERLFPGRVRDVEIVSGQPFPDSHSAYFGNEAVWRAAKELALS